MEEIDGGFQFLRREMKPLWRPSRAGGVERHSARDSPLRQCEKRRIAAGEIGLRCERKPRHVLEAADLDIRPIAARAVERTGGAGIGNRLAQALKLPAVKGGPCQRLRQPGPFRDPSVERCQGHLTSGSLRPCLTVPDVTPN